MGSHLDLLVGLLEVDPWGPADHETGDSTCHYCGSGVLGTRVQGEHVEYFHFSDCVWVLACAEVGMALPSTHGIYVPPPPVACGECGYTYTYDDHGQVTGHGDREVHDAHWLATVRADTRRAIADAFPLLRPRRGAVLPPLPASGGKITTSDGQVYETNERTIRAEIIMPWTP